MTNLPSSEEQSVSSENRKDNPVPHFYRVAASEFQKIPGSPIAYWASPKLLDIFTTGTALSDIASPKKGNSTSNNDRFLRLWFEVGYKNIGIRLSSYEGKYRWIPYNKGGGYRKWYGNGDYLIDWKDEGAEIRKIPTAVITNESYYFKKGLTWTTVTSSRFSLRFFDEGFIFDNGGCCLFSSNRIRSYLLGLLNSSLFEIILAGINPTLNFQSGEISKFPVIGRKQKTEQSIDTTVEKLIALSRADWDAYERSWDFTIDPLVKLAGGADVRLADLYADLRACWEESTLQMQRLEEENNRLFIDAYGLAEELSPAVPLREVTLTCNPYYRYGKDAPDTESPKSTFPRDTDLEKRLRYDTMRELLSYAVGCMMGRYSLNKPGLVLANAGDNLDKYQEIVGMRGEEECHFDWRMEKSHTRDLSTSLEMTQKGSASPEMTHDSSTSPKSTFMPDADGVIPFLDDEWSKDDIVARTHEFLRAAFGATHFAENLRFVEESLGKDLRKYFLRDFYKEHVQTYKKRPIYWMFASPKDGFAALVYLHRYHRDTANVVLNKYLREYENKLTTRIDHLHREESSAEDNRHKNAARKQADTYAKILDECQKWERDVLLPLAQQRLELDLDDGVKVNYPKLGKALKKITDLS